MGDHNLSRLYELLLSLHLIRRRWAVDNFGYGGFYGTPLSASQAHALLRLSISSSGVSELAKQLGLDQSSVSRLAQGLVKAGYLVMRSSAGDLRHKSMSLTKKAGAALRKLREHQNQATMYALSRLSFAEQVRLGGELNKLADGFGARALKEDSRLHAVAQAFRRLTPVFGSSGGRSLVPFRSFTETQVLRVAAWYGRATLRDIYRALPYEESSLRRSVARLIKAGLVEQRVESETGAMFLELSRKGEQTLKQVEVETLKAIKAAVSGPVKVDALLVVDLLEKALANQIGFVNIPRTVSCVVLDNEHKRKAARRLWIKNLGAAGDEVCLPGHLFAPEDFCLGVYSRHELCGACAIAFQGKEAEVVNLVVDKMILQPEAVVQLACREFFKRNKAREIAIGESVHGGVRLPSRLLTDVQTLSGAVQAPARRKPG